MDTRISVRAGRRRLLAAALALGSGSSWWSVAHAQAQGLYSRTLPGPDGEDVPLSRFLGKPLVVNFWATWCPPCVKEMPDLDQLAREHPQAAFLGVAVDTTRNVERFLRKVPVAYPVVIAGHGGIALMKELGNDKGGLPYTVLYDARGTMRRQFLGQIHPEDVARALTELPVA